MTIVERVHDFLPPKHYPPNPNLNPYPNPNPYLNPYPNPFPNPYPKRNPNQYPNLHPNFQLYPLKLFLYSLEWEGGGGG